jgi:Protein of unknown function (DUF2892).
MKVNVGGIDRILRIVVGLVLILLAATGTVGWWGWIGVVPLLTGLFKFCPLYTLLGMNTCPMEKNPEVRFLQIKMAASA